jgi:hypothetical protein
MKHAAWLLLGVLCSALVLFAEDKGREMKGTICNSACVTRQADLSTCDTTCTERSGKTVLVSDDGKVKTIANQEMAMPHMGKHVKCTAVPTEEEREDSIRITELYEEAP